MNFLDIPHPMSERSPSQTSFVIEEDGSEFGDTIGENTNDITSRHPSSSFLQFWSKTIIGTLSFLCIGFIVALVIVSVLYANTFPEFEICRTKACSDTATLLMHSMDDTVNPCEDFHKFSCGNWITDTATVVAVSLYDHTTIMRDRILGRLRSLTENISMSDIPALHELKYMYDSCVDLESIDKAGLKPLVRMVKEMISMKYSVAQTLGKIRRVSGQSYIIDLSVSVDYMNTSYNTIFLDQPQLPVSKETILSNEDIIQAYEFLIQSVATILAKEFGTEYSIFQEMVDNMKMIVDYEIKLASAMTSDDQRTKPKLYNLMTVRELNRLFSGQDMFGNDNTVNVSVPSTASKSRISRQMPHVHFNWTEYFEIVFDGIIEINENTTVIVNDLGYINGLANFMNTTNRHDIDMYLTWQLIFTMGKDVTSEVRSLFNRFSEKMEGNEAIPNRRTSCISLLDDQLSFLLTHKYVLKYVKHGVIDETDEIAQNVIKSFKFMVSHLDWMDKDTKARAILKADHVRKFIGYPAWLTNPIAVQAYYKGLKFTNSFFHNMITLMKWQSLRNLRQVGQLVDLSWSDDTDSPAEADAFYVDEINAITFPAGFLQQPFIGMGIRAADYGALGSVIGHELTHGFDTEGRYSDEYGRLNSWWSVETLQRFVQKAECFVDQYNAYRLPELQTQLGDNDTINGRRTLAENIADNGGIREALHAYRYYITETGTSEERLPGLEKYSPEQIFFLTFAQSWCSYSNPTSLEEMVLTNEHSPSRFRIIGPLSNFDEFSKVWSCKSGSKMNPEKKCVLW